MCWTKARIVHGKGHFGERGSYTGHVQTCRCQHQQSTYSTNSTAFAMRQHVLARSRQYSLSFTRGRSDTASRYSTVATCYKYCTSAAQSVFSFLRTLTTWHCPHLSAARRYYSIQSISPALRAHSSKPAAAGLLLWAHAATDTRTDREMDGRRNVT